MVNQIKGLTQFSFITSHPKDTSIDLFKSMRDSRKIKRYLHLPVQSGSDRILQLMNRGYTREVYLGLIQEYRRIVREGALSTDIIVGFPTESDEQFQNSIELLKKARPDITNITRFSARPLTPAKKMSGRLKTEIVKKRSQILSKLCNKISLEKNQIHVGKQYDILITEIGKEGTFVGRAENYKPVVIREKVTVGNFISVQIIAAASTYLVGSII